FVHLRHYNRSMINGHFSEEEMRREHPAHLDEIHAGAVGEPTPADTLRKRRLRFFPAYVLAVVIGAAGVVAFLTYEDVAIKTVPPPIPPEQVFVPYSPPDDGGTADAAIRGAMP
ncbi:MAG: hypothetical protein ABFR89_07030, partial [Actinomycetota bacterium]